MKKLMFIFILFVLFALPSCDNHAQYSLEAKDSEVSLDSFNISHTKYIISINSKTFHTEECYIAKNIKEENVREIYDREFLIDRDYTPCKRCNP